MQFIRLMTCAAALMFSLAAAPAFAQDAQGGGSDVFSPEPIPNRD